jgi:hypothetical protein
MLNFTPHSNPHLYPYLTNQAHALVVDFIGTLKNNNNKLMTFAIIVYLTQPHSKGK